MKAVRVSKHAFFFLNCKFLPNRENSYLLRYHWNGSIRLNTLLAFSYLHVFSVTCIDQHASDSFERVRWSTNQYLFPAVENVTVSHGDNFCSRSLEPIYTACVAGPDKGKDNVQVDIFSAIATYLGDAQPDVGVPLRIVQAKLELFSLVGVQIVRLESVRVAARRDGAVVVMVVEHVQRPGSGCTKVEGNSNLLDVLGFFEVVRDAASVVPNRAVKDITLARPARVGPDIIVSGVLGYATVRAAATPRRPCVVPISFNVNPCPLAGVD